MLPLRSRRIQRAIALLFVWCFIFGALEAPVADVHDGGATHAEVDRVTAASHAEHGNVTGGSVPERSAPDSSDHPVHVCHCTHVHAGVPALSQFELHILDHIVLLQIAAAVSPSAVALDPPTHPPII